MDKYKMTIKDFVKPDFKQKEPDIVKTVGDKGFDVQKTNVDTDDLSYKDFLKHMPDTMGNLPRRTWEPIAEAVAKLFENEYVPMKVDDDSKDNK